jgi:UDP-N-acetyl-D-mannosaminuronic acid dehydrogenase
LAEPLKVYDPFIKNDIVKNQYHDLDKFLADVDLVVIMVGHNEIKENMEKLKNKVILDTRKVCALPNIYRL